ncbi:TRAP transporter small permease [Calditrichota bacterium]
MKIDAYMAKGTAFLVIAVLLSMVFFAFLQVILRNFFNSGIPWAEVILRHLVLWVAMLGGLLATRESRQISIDLLTRVRIPALSLILRWLGSLFTLVVVIILARAAQVFVLGEQEFGSTLYKNIPSWYAQVILPVGFYLIGFQILLNLALGRSRTFEPTAEEIDAENQDEKPNIPEDEANE